MPQYEDTMLDHLAVGTKNVFWPDQPISSKSRSRTYSARSLLASLRGHHWDSYTVSPDTSTTNSVKSCNTVGSTLPPRGEQYSKTRQRHSLNRSHSYTESPRNSGCASDCSSPSVWSCTPSPTFPHKQWSYSPPPLDSQSTSTSTSTLNSCYPYVSTPDPISNPGLSSPRFTSGETVNYHCRSVSSICFDEDRKSASPIPTLTPPPTPVSRRLPPPSPQPSRDSKSGFYNHCDISSSSSTSSPVGCLGLQGLSSSKLVTPLRRLPPPAPLVRKDREQNVSTAPTELYRSDSLPSNSWCKYEQESDSEVDRKQCRSSTLGRPVEKSTNSKNRRAQRMNQMSMEKNTAQYRQWLADSSTKPSKKGPFTARALSFRKRFEGKMGKSPIRPPIEKVEPRQTSESLASKVEHVWRALDFYKDVIDKSITDMLPGSATVVLEMIIALNLALKPCFANQNSNAVSSAIATVHHSVAELVRWSDQLLLYGDEAQNTQTVHQVVDGVRVAVQTLIDLAADKENLNTSDSSILNITPPSSVDNNNSVNLEKSPHTYYSNRNSTDNGSSSNHRNSLPEIKTDSPEQNRHFLSPRDSTKLIHSQSSDSILNSSDVEPAPPKPPLPGGRVEVAPPPLPPKLKFSYKGTSTSENGLGNSLDLTSPLGHSSPINRSPRGSTTEWPHSLGSASFTTSSDRVSRTSHSSDQMSPASSLDSMNQSQEESPAPISLHTQSRNNVYNPLIDQFNNLDFEKALHKNFALTSDNCLQELGRHFKMMNVQSLSPESLSSLRSTPLSSDFNSLRSSSSHLYSQVKSHSYKQSTTETHISSSSQVSSKMTHSQRIISYQHTATRSSTASSVSSASTSSSASEGERFENRHILQVAVPPELPLKRGHQGRRSNDFRFPVSTYENVDTDIVDSCELRFKKDDPSPKLPPKVGTLQLGSSSSSSTSSVNSGGFVGSTTSMMSNSSTSSSNQGSSVVTLRRHTTMFQGVNLDDDNPPPLPVKKKHVMDYMKLFGQVSEPNENELLRRSVHQMHMQTSSDWYFHDFELGMEHISLEDGSVLPPALPPKQNKRVSASTRSSLPPGSQTLSNYTSDLSKDIPIVPMIHNRKSTEEKAEPEEVFIHDQSLEVDRRALQDSIEIEEEEKQDEEEEDIEGPLDMLAVKEYLVWKKEGEEGPDIRGGPVDALIVHASKANQRDFLYQEAFLTTYRTFITPEDLVNKLLDRYHKFIKTPDVERQKAARNAFSLLVRVVDDLAISDLNVSTLKTLTSFEYILLHRGELLLARALRKKIVEKLEARKQYNAPKESLSIASLGVTTKQSNLLDFKSQEIAEQMTLLDAELFDAMEIPEVLLWPPEQNEEKSPNLTTFTEHFNKMSYWARSRILEQVDAKDREKCVMKFIKIMKRLRNMNNFNSYLALLSALDSAPIRRLEWQKNITDGLKEYCALIDSSCAFRAYRQALSETSPPCIPYIGLILQDLTFVDIGNSHLLPDGNVNFSKRWQQFNILDNMKRFKKCQYSFKKNEKIIAFFNNFDDHLNEEALWHISESIKPRGGAKKK